MKKHLSNIILIVILLAGLSLLLYPTVSDYWNKFHQSQAIADYAEAVANLDREDYERLWTEAKAFRRKNTGNTNPCWTFLETGLWVILR